MLKHTKKIENPQNIKLPQNNVCKPLTDLTC